LTQATAQLFHVASGLVRLAGAMGQLPGSCHNAEEMLQEEPLEMYFPMWLVPGKVLMQLQHPLPAHEQLVQDNMLVRWQMPHSRLVIFVSHQWLGKDHPDPEFKQFAVLQQALQNMSEGKLSARRDVISDLLSVSLPSPSEKEQRNCLEWDFWYDYMCCPQRYRTTLGDAAGRNELQQAIQSIPAYSDVADHTLVLVPCLQHVDTGETLSLRSWDKRGWCRAERMAAHCARRQKALLVLRSAHCLQTSGGPEWVTSWPGGGVFTLDSDRDVLCRLSERMLDIKCDSLRRQGDWKTWRFYRSLGPHVALVANNNSSEELGDFLQKYHMPTDGLGALEGGLTPLMLAVIEGNLSITRRLLELKVDVDEPLAFRFPEAHIQGNVITALSLAASLSTKVTPLWRCIFRLPCQAWEAVKLLLDAKASVDLPCGASRSSLLTTAAYFGNSDVMPTLIEARCSLTRLTTLGGCALFAAVRTSNAKCTEILLAQRADPNRRNYVGATPLSFTCMFSQEPAHAKLLLDARASVNEIHHPDGWLFSGIGWVSRQKVKMEGASNLHWNLAVLDGGSLLHVAALNGCFEIAEMLLSRRADPTTTWDGWTPLKLALRHGHDSFESLLGSGIA